jgi:hypothetical protein
MSPRLRRGGDNDADLRCLAMPTCRSSVSIEATLEKVFAYLADVRNIPHFVAAVGDAAPVGGGSARVTSGDTTKDVELKIEEGHRHRVEWDGGGCKGWLEVDREGQVCSVTAEVEAEAIDDPTLDQALWTLKEQIES